MHDGSGQALAALVPPELRELLRGHPLTLQRPVWGQRAGRHSAARVGLGQLFRAHRPYVAGDDPRHLDWRAMARRDRAVIRQTEGEDELSLVTLIDASGGMAYGTGSTQKRTTAAALVGALALLALRQGDRLGFAVGDGDGVDAEHLRPGAGTQRLHALALALGEHPSAGVCPWPALVAACLGRLPRRSLVVAVSDFLDPCAGDPRPSAEEDLWASFAQLRAQGHDVVLLQVLHRDELTFPWSGGELLRFVDPRGARPELEGTGAALQATYRRRLADHLATLARRAEAGGIHLARVVSDEPLAPAFLDLLGRLAGAAPGAGEGASARERLR